MTLRTEYKDRILAGVVTTLVVLLLLLVLFVGKVGWSRATLAEASMPEEGQEEEIEFLEPELLPNAGQEDVKESRQDAPPTSGMPEQVREENRRISEPKPQPAKAPSKERMATQKAPSPVAEPKRKGEEEKKKATQAVAGKFNQNNGLTEGKFDSAGSAGTSVGVDGHMNGRQFLGCPKPDVSLSHKTVVRVSIIVDASGKVTSASAGGGASAAIRRACEAAARQARWSAKEGAPFTRGSITFTITPR